MSRALLPLRRWLVPDERGLGWMPLYTLGYLVFLLSPALFSLGGIRATSSGRLDPAYWGLTALSVLVFLPLYFGAFRQRGPKQLWRILAIAALAHALMPFNPFSNTYTIYALALLPFTGLRLGGKAAIVTALLGLFAWQVQLLAYPAFNFAITAMVGVAVFIGNHHFAQNLRRQADLRLSHDEVRRLAGMAERERIGRDLHDLLGHTLSLVALKSELAGKLIERDPLAARREIDEVMRVSRDALSQVRRAVSGIRAAGLAAELASARLLLECDGVAFEYEMGEVALTPELETALALAVREAVTNIQRHARAANAHVALRGGGGVATLVIQDDGRGGAIVAGNGLDGMRERIASLRGQCRVDSRPGQGTRLEIVLPLPDPSADAPHATLQPRH
ncbi:MAG TPA: sensor histidine kinase [Pseudoxanthomonas sp.]|nr:sensor histidine kinase [Pseudoxanthomonas sp.]